MTIETNTNVTANMKKPEADAVNMRATHRDGRPAFELMTCTSGTSCAALVLAMPATSVQ
jgi:hypothetical protein